MNGGERGEYEVWADPDRQPYPGSKKDRKRLDKEADLAWRHAIARNLLEIEEHMREQLGMIKDLQRGEVKGYSMQRPFWALSANDSQTTTNTANVTYGSAFGAHMHMEDTIDLENSDETMIRVHRPSECEGQPCPLHRRTKHHMRHLVQRWDTEHGRIDRICDHGIDHPDPDSPDWVDRDHDCDGCCVPPDTFAFGLSEALIRGVQTFELADASRVDVHLDEDDGSLMSFRFYIRDGSKRQFQVNVVEAQVDEEEW